MADPVDAPRLDYTAWRSALICRECRSQVKFLRDGVCIYCHYVLCGGDQAADEDLRGAWYAWLA